MNSMKLTELKALAKGRGLHGYSRMKKKDLIDALSVDQTPKPKHSKPNSLRDIVSTAIGKFTNIFQSYPPIKQKNQAAIDRSSKQRKPPEERSKRQESNDY